MASITHDIRKWLPPRKKAVHKGEFGRLFILAGSRGLTGAAYLATLGALRSGAGLVTLGLAESLRDVFAVKCVEAMTKPLAETAKGTLGLEAEETILSFLRTQDVLALGPGLSQVDETQKLIRRVVEACHKPMVLDADALNAFVGHPGTLAKVSAPMVLTPHPGEFSRLFQVPSPASEADRLAGAKKFAKQFHSVVVLKGYHTVVASPRGETFVNPTGNPGLAKGGSGDLLFGMIAGMLAQKLDPFDAARAGVYLHGLAADLAVKKFGEISLLATDVAGYIHKAIIKVRGI